MNKMRTSISFRIKKKTVDLTRIQTLLKSKIGLWIDGNIFWIQNGTEKLIPKKAISIKINQKGIHSKIKFLDIFVTNHNEIKKDLKLIVMHHFDKYSKNDFTFISPTEKVIFHLANRNLYLVNGQINGTLIDDYTVQPSWNIYTEKFWDSQRKGTLKYQPMSQGPSTSIFTLNMEIPAFKTLQANTWKISGIAKGDLLRLNHLVLKNTLAFPYNK
ncbi:hypothetical protein [Bacillus sp. 1NLA3E]|uniref:hypothetical protein n=1 Tax=Bacillus sp. 1NLA3E TaxID=666686 RepID=UPI00031E10D2|nr:hypothetical protein [Bacillus sp. 1NLA3E]